MTKLFSNLILLLLLTFALWSCNNDDPQTPEIKGTLTVAKAKEWYENFVMKNSLSNQMKAKIARNAVDSLQPLLNWDMAELDNDSVWSVVELPWEYKDYTVQISNSEVSEYATLQNDKSVIKQVIRLVILQNRKTGETYGFKMVVVPDLDYMLRKDDAIAENKYLQRGSDLSGTVLFYTISDDFVNGWKYKNGKITSQLMKYKTDQKSNGFKSSNGLDTYMVTVCNFYKTEIGNYVSYGSDCYNSYYLVIDFAFDAETGTKGNFDTGYSYGGEVSVVYDCFGVANGNAYTDQCNECVGGTTGKIACDPCTEINKLLNEIFNESSPMSVIIQTQNAPQANCCGQGYIKRNDVCVSWASISAIEGSGGIGSVSITKDYLNYSDALRYLQTFIDGSSSASSYGIDSWWEGGAFAGLSTIVAKILRKFATVKTLMSVAGGYCTAAAGTWAAYFKRQSDLYSNIRNTLLLPKNDGKSVYIIGIKQSIPSMGAGVSIPVTQYEFYTSDGCPLGNITY